MRSASLKRIRVFLAIVVAVFISAIFLDFRSLIPVQYFDSILFLQFVPSLLRFIDVSALAASGFIIIILLTFITGRTYCSVLCPLGVYQDVISRIGGKIRKKYRRFGFKRPFTIIRYGLLGITLIVALSGGIYLVSLLDPYSTFGRFSTYFFKPVLLIVNNLVAGIVNKYDVYSIYKVEVKTVTVMAYIIPSFFLLVVTLFSFRRGRLYCNSICPVGTFLGLISKVSVLRIKIEASNCSRCGRCALACKSSCIDFMNRTVDLSRCVACYNCLQSCPDKAITYGLPEFRKEDKTVDTGKREFIAGSLLLFFGLNQTASAKEVPVCLSARWYFD